MNTTDVSKPQRFGGALRRARGAAGLTQHKLAKLAGVSHVSVSLIEGGKTHYPRATTIAALNKVLEGRLDGWL